MSTPSTTNQAAAPKQPQSRPLSSKVYKNTFVRSLRSEIRKMTSLRSTWLTLGLWLGFGILITWAMAATLTNGQNNVGGINVHGEFHPIFITGSAQLYYIFAMVLGALAVTGEYASNTMRTTIVSQTSRMRAFTSKIAAVTIVMGIATAVIIAVLVAVTLLAGGLSWNGGDGNLRALLLFWLARGLLQVEERCTLAHELIHIERGHRGCQPPRIEADVEREAARRLIPLDLLGEALTWARCEAEAADELCVDIATLRTRLADLTRAERARLRRRLADLSAP